jgi:hypothetical protein
MHQGHPVPYSPAVETPEPREAETTADIIETLRKISETTYKDGGHALRSVHAKSHGFLRCAECQDVPEPNARMFLSSLKLLAATTDQPQILKKVISTVMRGAESVVEAFGGESVTLKTLGGAPQTHPLGETFYTQTAFRYGDYIAKFSVAPASKELTALTGRILSASGEPNLLRDTVTEFFRRHSGTWEVRVQLCTDLKAMPIEDASVTWPEDRSPYVTVARILVPTQTGWSKERSRAVDDGFAFSPWHGLAAHRPLGSLKRVRKPSYEMSANFRAERNGCPIHEPGEGARLPE